MKVKDNEYLMKIKNLQTHGYMQTSITIGCLNEYSNCVSYTNIEGHTVA